VERRKRQAAETPDEKAGNARQATYHARYRKHKTEKCTETTDSETVSANQLPTECHSFHHPGYLATVLQGTHS